MTPKPAPSAQTLEILRTLIAFDTTSRNSNLGLIEWVRDRLRRQGLDTRLTYDERGTKANLFATAGPLRNGGLIFSGHTDVVPADGQSWKTEPFNAALHDGKVYGRGTCDMKGFIACALAAMPQMAERSADRPFHLALSYDEELGCLGVRELIADLAEQDLRPAACIVGEPTSMKPVVAHKGQRQLRCCVRGREGHASDPERCLNAIEYAARLISWVQDIAAREASAGRRDEGFAVPHTTLSCTVVNGGIAVNIVPNACEFIVDLRYLPGTNADAIVEELKAYAQVCILPTMKERSGRAQVEWTVINDSPALADSTTGALVGIVQRSVGHAGHGRVSYNTEAGLFQRAGIPTVLCGPGRIEQAHRPDEFVELSQLAECERFLSTVCGEFQTAWKPTRLKA